MMYRVIACAPQWAIDRGEAEPGDTDEEVFDNRHDADEHRQMMEDSGCRVRTLIVSDEYCDMLDAGRLF